MTSFYREFFKSHPDPMWILDEETLQFLDVNDAAVAEYGYSEAEFAQMTASDLLPPDEVEAAAGTTRHVTKSGAIVVVETRSHLIDFRDRKANLVTARNVSELVAARKEADRLSQRLYRKLNSISDGFYTLDRDWRITFVNRRACELVERSVESLTGRVIWEVYPEMRGEPFEFEFRKAMESQTMAEFTDSNAFGRWFVVKVYPTDEGLAIFFQDVSAQRRQESQIQLLETAVSHLNDIVLITEAGPLQEPGSRIVYVNDAFVRQTGYNREEAIGRSPRFLQGPETDEVEGRRLLDSLNAGKPVRSELVNYTKAGEPYWIEMEIVPILSSSGEATHFVGVQRNVTERKRAAEELAQSEERFRIVTQATTDVVWDWNVATDQIWWNDGLKSAFGYDPATLFPDSTLATDAIHADDRERVSAGIQAAIDSGETTWSDEYRFIRADGSIAQVIDRGFLIRDGGGMAVRAVGSMVDVTQQRKLEAQLRQSQRLEAVGQLTGGVAHDFNNLLTVILGNSEFLTQRLIGDDTLHPFAEMIFEAAKRGAELTNGLLAFSRRQALDPKAVNVTDLIRGMETLLRRSLGEQVEIVLAFTETPDNALIDAAQLESALLNLCINARDAMEHGGKLTIEVENAQLDQDYVEVVPDAIAGDYVVIAVSDTGSGMDPLTAAQAFEPFFTTKEVGRGSGLGLSMVYGFIKQSKGHVRIYSELGVGTTVRLYLPRASNGQDVAKKTEIVSVDPTGTEAILIVEDDDLVRTHVAGVLRMLGYQVNVAANGSEGLEFLRGGGICDLLFTDVVMPGGLGGRQLAEAARQLRPDLPVLFTSGYTENAIIHNGRLDAGVQLLQKPYQRRDLAVKIRAVLDEGVRPSKGSA